MQEVYEKIIEKLEESAQGSKDSKDLSKYSAYKQSIEIVKQAAEEYNNGWIPCSERLPNKDEYLKDDGRFIVTDGNRRYQSIYDIYQGKFRTSKLYGGWRDYEIDNCAIAWQPLPEPYQPKDC